MEKKVLLGVVLEKYGNTKLHFSHYNKFTFYFSGLTDDGIITVSFGGNADDIYEFDFDKDEEILLKDYADIITGITVSSEDIL